MIKMTFHYFAMFVISSSIMKWNDNRVTNTFYKTIYIKNLYYLYLSVDWSCLQVFPSSNKVKPLRHSQRYEPGVGTQMSEQSMPFMSWQISSSSVNQYVVY